MNEAQRPYPDLVFPGEQNHAMHMYAAWEMCDVFKMLYYHIEDPNMFAYLKGISCVHLKRKNLLAQYVSVAVARHNKRWTCDYKNTNKVTINLTDFHFFLEQHRNYLDTYNKWLTNAVNIYYEDSMEEKCRKLAIAFDLEPFEPKTELIKTNPVDLSLVVENYDEVKEYDIDTL